MGNFGKLNIYTKHDEAYLGACGEYQRQDILDFCHLTTSIEMLLKGIIKGYPKYLPNGTFIVMSYTPNIGPFVKQRSWRSSTYSSMDVSQ